jgi:hypothetical protein
VTDSSELRNKFIEFKSVAYYYLTYSLVKKSPKQFQQVTKDYFFPSREK